jgi:LAO/AO transport system kinase
VSGGRLIRWLEDGDPRGLEALRVVYPQTGNAHLIGITGAPGAGKSTLVDALIAELRRREHRVGVVAVDPSSPFSGGALLGDRVRMQRHATDDGVFIRSMATRGRLGGLARATFEATLVLDAMGYDVILIETVGVGQDELEIADLAWTTIVVSVPGLGDDIQAIKAGILEVADVFVLNKADRPGADDAERHLRMMLHLRAAPPGGWSPPLIRTVAARGEGVTELVEACESHRGHLRATGQIDAVAARRSEHFFREILRERAADTILRAAAASDRFADLLEAVRARRIDPYSASEALLAAFEPRFEVRPGERGDAT